MEAWQGQGAYGAVYRALPVNQEHAGPVALKLALYPWDARFAREAELLSRLSHPSIPALRGSGLLRHPSGTEHPFVVMEWVDGTPLYAWAQQNAPTDRQVCQLLAQLARALETLHASGAVHRDVKGDNVLVRHSDSRAVLIDFGSCHFQGAQRLTWQSLPPSTPGYLSAQACVFHLRSVRERDGYYPPSPADDLFALGVTAYRLVVGQYPPELEPHQDEEDRWHVVSPDPRPLLEQKAQVLPLLREWILRLLSDDPQARGTATELAEALEAMAHEEVPVPPPAPPPAAEVVPLKAPASSVSTGTRPERTHPLPPSRAWKPWVALAAAGVAALLLWPWQSKPVLSGDLTETTPRASDSQVPAASEQVPSSKEPPPEPRPGQTRPDQKGRCPGPKQVLINGGCWVENPLVNAEECAANGYVVHKGKCYSPSLAPPQKPVPTSNPAKAR